VDTYGIHGIHGRAPVIATGIKLANPELKVFVITGDGDGLSIGGNHYIHLCRRNVDITVILFNNRIYGLTKGQYSPTSQKGQITKSSPYGVIENPFNPIKMALASGATFVARTIDREVKHLAEMIRLAAEHKGTSFVEVYQNCVIFNDGAFKSLTDKTTKKENLLTLENGKPLIFGNNDDKALNWTCNNFEVIHLDENTDTDALIRHDATTGHAAAEFALADLNEIPGMPTPIGVFRDIKEPTYEELLHDQIEQVTKKKGKGTLHDLLYSGNTYVIE